MIPEKYNDYSYFKIKEIATFLRVHPQTIRNAIHDKKIEATKIGNEYRIPRRELEDYINRNSTLF